MKGIVFALAVALLAASEAAARCPSAVKSAALAAHPGSTVASCKRACDSKSGRTTYAIRLADPGGGAIAVSIAEEPVAWEAVPPAVAAAYAEARGAATPRKVIRRTGPGDRLAFEIDGTTFDAPAVAKECPKPRAECVCPMNYAPVRCEGDCEYPNACAADCAGATGCAPVKPTS